MQATRIRADLFSIQADKLLRMEAHGSMVNCFAIHKLANIGQQPLYCRSALPPQPGIILQQPGNHVCVPVIQRRPPSALGRTAQNPVPEPAQQIKRCRLIIKNNLGRTELRMRACRRAGRG